MTPREVRIPVEHDGDTVVFILSDDGQILRTAITTPPRCATPTCTRAAIPGGTWCNACYATLCSGVAAKIRSTMPRTTLYEHTDADAAEVELYHDNEGHLRLHVYQPDPNHTSTRGDIITVPITLDQLRDLYHAAHAARGTGGSDAA